MKYSTVNAEKYAHTPVKDFFEGEYDSDMSDRFEKPEKIPAIDAVEFYTYNGKCCDDSLRADGGYVFGSIAAALHSPKYSEAVKKYFGKLADRTDPAVACNIMSDCRGIFVATDPFSVCKKSLAIINLTGAEKPVLNRMHNLFIFEEQSVAEIVEYNISLAEHFPAIADTVSETVVGKNAKVNIVHLTEYSPISRIIFSDFYKQFGNSTLNHINIAADGGAVRTNTEVCLAEKQCSCNLYGLSVASGKQHIDSYTCINHAAPESSSNELYKSIAGDSARCIFNGRILVQPEAQKTVAYQSSKNMLLSRSARIHAKPQLEIYADDVKCSHGATVGQLSDEELFYMQARGISRKTARQLLLSGFAGEIVDKVSGIELREFLASKIYKRLAAVAD